MNYHKYISVPKPVRSNVTATVSTASSTAQHGGNSVSPSGLADTAVDASAANQTTLTNAAVSGITAPMVNGIKKEPGAGRDLQINNAGSSQGRTEPTDRETPSKNTSGAKKTKKQLKSMFRRPLTGDLGRRLYTMPPLPPTSTTLGAFKSLLLDRLRLLRIAGIFHIDSVLGIPKELEQELSTVATGKNEAQTTAGENGAPSGSAADGSDIPRSATRTVAPECYDDAEGNRAGPYPPIIRSDVHADHWMKMIRNTHDYQMLRSRFLSLFLWPSLLSSVRVKNETDDAETSSKRTVASLVGSGRLVAKPTDVDREEKNEEDLTARAVRVWPYVRPQYR